MKTVVVESLDVLTGMKPDGKCSVVVGEFIYDIIPANVRAGVVVKFVDSNGKSVTLRLRRIEKIPLPVRKW